MIFLNTIWDAIGTNHFQNILLLVAALVALGVGYGQIKVADNVEIYASVGLRPNVNYINGQVNSQTPVIWIQNVGTRIIYLDKYVFNGKVYQLDGQVLPSTYSNANNPKYWIELPDPEISTHVSLEVFYHDISDREWRSEVFADFSGNTWRIKSLPRERVGNN